MSQLFDFSQFPILNTDRLHLRQLTYDDIDDIIVLYSSPQILQFLNQPATDTLDKARGLINWFADMFDNGESVQWGISLKGENHLIGTCGNYQWEQDDRKIDIGYQIHPDHWGQGYATEACHAILGWSFENLNLHRIQADCTVGNIASERVLLKCGFQVEGIWRESTWEHGRFVDVKQFGLLRREYMGDNE